MNVVSTWVNRCVTFWPANFVDVFVVLNWLLRMGSVISEMISFIRRPALVNVALSDQDWTRIGEKVRLRVDPIPAIRSFALLVVVTGVAAAAHGYFHFHFRFVTNTAADLNWGYGDSQRCTLKNSVIDLTPKLTLSDDTFLTCISVNGEYAITLQRVNRQ